MRGSVVVLLVLGALAGCLSDPDADSEETGPAAVVRFLVIGDQGTGGEAQYQVAQAMKQVCAERGCDFVIANGDNLYEAGAEDPYDERFEELFERPYEGIDLPFYLTLGNHDNDMSPVHAAAGTETGGGLGLWGRAGDHEVAYTFRDDRTTDRWNMPGRWYHVDLGVPELTVRLVSLDTSAFLVEGLPVLYDDPMNQQQKADVSGWVQDSPADWTFVFSHHPYRSNGQHDDAGSYDGFEQGPLAGDSLEAFYQGALCGHADAFFAGHDHDLQWLEPQDDCAGTHLFVSGAAGKTRSLADEDNPYRFQQGDIHGFLWVELRGDRFTGAFFDADAALLYEDHFDRVAGET
ncbi:MAG: metallophosphoesterase [Thermoplasmatota archaeon]